MIVKYVFTLDCRKTKDSNQNITRLGAPGESVSEKALVVIWKVQSDQEAVQRRTGQTAEKRFKRKEIHVYLLFEPFQTHSQSQDSPPLQYDLPFCFFQTFFLLSASALIPHPPGFPLVAAA